MAPGSLGEFLGFLQDRHQLRRVDGLVSANFELTELSRRWDLSSQNTLSPVLIFDRVAESPLPVVTNLFSELQRLVWAFGAQQVEEIETRLREFLSRDLPGSWQGRFEEMKRRAGYQRLMPVVVKEAECQYVVRVGRDVDVTTLPWIRNWVGESGPAFLCGQWSCIDPETGQQLVSEFPVLPLDGQHLALRWEQTSILEEFWGRMQRRGQPIAASVSFGGPPSVEALLRWSALQVEHPYLLAGILSGVPVELVRCRTSDLLVPARAEIVLEGMIDPKMATIRTGAVAHAHGILLGERECPIMKIGCMTQRPNPLFLTKPVDTQATELGASLRLWERLLKCVLQVEHPEIIDVHFPKHAAGRWLIVSIKKRRPFEMVRVLHALWGMPDLITPMQIVGVDDDVDIRQTGQVMQQICSHADPDHDYITTPGISHEADPRFQPGQKMSLLGIDATRKLPSENRPLASQMGQHLPDDVRQQIELKWNQLSRS